MEEGLKFISGADERTRTADIVFVHGLRGHYKRTWHPHGDTIKTDEELDKDTEYFPFWIAEEFSNVSIWSYRYVAEPSQWSTKFSPGDKGLNGITMSLYMRSKSLLASLKDNDIGSRPLIFICHSLGGLIIKRVLREASDLRDNQDNDSIINNTKGVVFIATPHTGADLATVLEWLGKVGQVTTTGRELVKSNPGLINLSEWYRLSIEKSDIDIAGMVFFETQPLPNLMKVVDDCSANPNLSVNVEVTPVNAHHISIAKPSNQTSTVYLGVRRFIRKHLLTRQEASRLPELRSLVKEEDSRLVEEAGRNPQ